MSSNADPYRCYLGLPTPDGVDAQRLDRVKLEDVYGPLAGKVASELDVLLKNYGAELWLGQRHCAPSQTWRDESVLEPETKARFAVRVHLFEKSQDDGGRYLGFAVLRPNDGGRSASTGGGFRFVLEAELVPPRRMLRPRYHVITTTASSARLGVLPFRSAVYVAIPADEQRTSTCVHAAISQALHLTMGRFGTRPITHREFEAILWNMKRGKRSLANIAKTGATLGDALDVARQSCNAGGFIASFSAESQLVRLEAVRCLTDALANGLPVILQLDYSSLDPRWRPSSLHAYLLSGMHLLHCPAELGTATEREAREDYAELPGRFVGHDVFRGPFTEWPTARILNAALRATPDRPEIRFLALGPPELKLGLHEARRTALAWAKGPGAQEHLSRYAQRVGGSREVGEKWRFVTRMLQPGEVRARYYPEMTQGSSAPPLVAPYYWCVEVRHPQPRRSDDAVETVPAIVYLWDVGDAATAKPLIQWRCSSDTGRLVLYKAR